MSLSSIKRVDDYLARFAPALMGRLTRELRPLYDPSKEIWHPRLAELRRKPFKAQGDAVMGLHRVLSRQKFAVLVGEMGVGKTLMGAALSYVHLPARSRTLIMCPGHLVEKWAREIVETVPDASARIVRRISDLFHLHDQRKPHGREFYILPRDRAKLGYRRKAAYLLRRPPYKPPPPGREPDHAKRVACPACAAFILDKQTHAPVAPAALEAKQMFCPKCKGALWQADAAGVRRFAPAEYIKRRLKNAFDLYIADEVHELKGGHTAQGNAFGMLASAAKKTVCLTGTLVGGYAEHLFYTLYRIHPRGMVAGENLRYSQVQNWISRYGALETITRKQLSGKSLVYARGGRDRVSVRHRPGVSPLVFSRHLLASSVFVELADVADQLPALAEDVSVIPMSEDLRKSYKEIEGKFRALMRNRREAVKYLGAYLATLLSYPDRPFDNRRAPGVGELPDLPKSAVYPKEQALLDFVAGELAARRKVWVFATFTDTRDVTERLASLLKKRGWRVSVLKSDTVEVSEREAWIAAEVKRGVDVVISNPELVKTGLDLIAFPSIAFFETGWNTFTLMQASRRSWRVGQRLPVKVRYFCYADTLQEAALRLMGAKVRATQVLQGRFSSEGLTALSQSEDMMSALARALVDGLDGVDTAESYWRANRAAGGSFESAEKSEAIPSQVAPPEPAHVAAAVAAAAPRPTSDPVVERFLDFAFESAAAGRSRNTVSVKPGAAAQLVLF